MRKVWLIFIFLVISGNAIAQRLPPPVDIPIQNIHQETPVWCWAAVAQQIILGIRGPANTPPQCALVAIANNVHPEVCCSGYNPMCVRTGSIQQIQFLISYFGGRYSSYAPPADPMKLYRSLASRRPIILQVRTGIINSHVVVLRGMTFVRGQFGVEPVLHINDPLAHFAQPVPFSQIAPIWMDAIIVN